MLRVVALISGAGTNLQALLDACDDPAYPVTVVAVGADRASADLASVAARGCATFLVPYNEYPDRRAWGQALVAAVATYSPDVVLLSGLMRILPASAVAHWHPALINTHPALLPSFPGAHAVRDAIAAGVTATGATIHVVDEGVDTGPILDQIEVAVSPEDTESSLHDRIKIVERKLIVDTLRKIATGAITLA